GSVVSGKIRRSTTGSRFGSCQTICARAPRSTRCRSPRPSSTAICWKKLPNPLDLGQGREAAGCLIEHVQFPARDVEMQAVQNEQAFTHSLLDEGKGAEIGKR